MTKKNLYLFICFFLIIKSFSNSDTLEIKRQLKSFDSITGVSPAKAIEIGKRTEQLLNNEKIPQIFYLRLYSRMGKTYARLSDVKNTERYLKMITDIIGENPNYLWYKGDVYNSRSILLANSGDFQKAIECLLNAEVYYERSKYAYQKWEINQNLAILYAQTGNLQKALQSFLDVAHYHQTIPANRRALGDTYTNIGVVFSMQNQLDSALGYYQKSLPILSEDGNTQGLAMLLNNIAEVKLKQHKIDEGVTYLNRSLEMMRSTGDKKGLIIALNNIAQVLMDAKKPQEAMIYAKEAYQVATEGKLFHELASTNNILATLHFQKNDTKNAYLYSKRYAALNDSLRNSESIKQIAEMEAKYEAGNKQKEIELLKKDNEIQQVQNSRNKAIIFSLLAGSAVLAGMVFLIFRQYKEKKKVNAQLELKNNIIEEKQKEILDSIQYAKRIQHALLPTEKYLKKVLTKRT